MIIFDTYLFHQAVASAFNLQFCRVPLLTSFGRNSRRTLAISSSNFPGAPSIATEVKLLVDCGLTPKEAVELLLASKNETAKSKDLLIDEMAKSRFEILKSKDETIRLQDEIIGEKNAALLAVKCRLDLRSVMEDFENFSVAKGTRKSMRENKWDHILRTNQLGIIYHLFKEKRVLSEVEINHWITVAQSLYSVISKSIHNYSPVLITVNQAWLKDDNLILAVALCKAMPVSYEVVEV